MPLETVYLDIPYMKDYADFTVDFETFPRLQELADRLHKNGQRLVVIIDAAIYAEDISENNKYYTIGNEDDVFIKSGLYTSKKYNNNLISKVWPEDAVFVDWYNDKCMNVWSTGLRDLYDIVNYDGIWIDMNEPTTFWHGEKKVVDAEPIVLTKE
jgi:alpha-glucosidase